MSAPRIKICGITRLEDARAARELGAWALGFMFYSRSSRAIDPAAAGAILRALPRDTIGVGVFVNAPLAEILATVAQAGLKAVQLHGDESPRFCADLRERLAPEVALYKALRLASVDELASIEGYSTCDAILFETAGTGEYGGTGVTGDWALAAEASAKVPVILAGGLNAANVRRAVERVRPFALDVSSGVESSPGIKSRSRLKEFFDAAR